MTDIPPMVETDNPLEDARKYLVDYTEAYRNDAAAGPHRRTREELIHPRKRGSTEPFFFLFERIYHD